MGSSRHGPVRQFFSTYRGTFIVATTVTAAAVSNALVEHSETPYGAIFAGLMLLPVLLVTRFVEAADADPHSLQSAVDVLQRIHSSEDSTLRVCVYKGTSKNRKLRQVTTYGGTSKYASSGRTLLASKGAVGQALRENRPVVLNPPKDGELTRRQWLCRFHGFDDEELDHMKTDCHSWLAVPILGRDHQPVGVLYADSEAEGAFSDDTKVAAFAESCIEMGKYLS